MYVDVMWHHILLKRISGFLYRFSLMGDG